MAVTTADLAVAIGLTSGGAATNNAAQLARLETLLALVQTQVEARLAGLEGLPSMPATLGDELTLRYAAYLWDAPTRPDGDQFRNMAAAWMYSGCAALVSPYRRRRARTARAT